MSKEKFQNVGLAKSSKKKRVLQLIQCISSKKKIRPFPITYIQFIQELVQLNQGKVQIQSFDGQYSLLQDLKLMLEAAKQEQLTLNTFQEMAKIRVLNRDARSMYDRYTNTLYYVREAEIKTILRHICKYSLEGYLVREDEQIKIRCNPEIQQSQLLEVKEIKIIQIPQNYSSFSEQQNCKIQDVSFDKIQKEESFHQEVEISKIQKVKLELSHQNLSEFKQLKDILQFYSQFSRSNILDLLSSLDSLSGDLTAFSEYLETEDEQLKWSAEQDEALIKDDDDIIRYLIKRRGRANINRRRKYLLLS